VLQSSHVHLLSDGFRTEWDDTCPDLDKTVAHKEEWRVHCTGNCDESKWRGPDESGQGWEVTPPVGPSREVQDIAGDLSGWPGLEAQIDDQCGYWGPLSSDSLLVEQKVKIEERSSVGDFEGVRSACRLLMT
jgi:hypothetical protein